MAAQTGTTVFVADRNVKLTNLDKVLYPETATTKGDVIRYFAEIAPLLLPQLQDRPITRKRWVNGVGTSQEPGKAFFNKDIGEHAPEWIATKAIEHSDHVNHYPVIDNTAALIYFAQLATLEFHVPQWRFNAKGQRLHPDRLVLDLDPGEGASLSQCVAVAQLARELLADMGLDPIPVTSGSKGLHLYADLDGSATSEQVSQVAHELARALEADHPDLAISTMQKSQRHGKVLVDWSQNNKAKTTVAPYSLRGRERPMVAAPRTWNELDSPNLQQLTMDEVLERVHAMRDPFAAPPEPAADRLTVYRAKRNAEQTPEPVPTQPPRAQSGSSFVIQEHHARRLHYDFRLEKNGVLVSWALPKGVPTHPKKNHLAVQTEDHPLAYGSFEGTIPKGNYGAGTVTIWDAGDYELHKWIDGKEVVVTLHGRAAGGLERPRKVALIKTGPEPDHWLIHAMVLGNEKTSSHESPRRGPSRQTPLPLPMLATLGKLSDIAADGWAYEMKWDGIRAIIEVRDGATRIISRNGNDISDTFPELTGPLVEAVRGKSAVLDGEIVALDEHGAPSFSRLQHRLGVTKPSDTARLMATIPVHFMAFDLLNFNGDSLLGEPYHERRAIRHDALAIDERTAVQMPPAFDGEATQALDTSRQLRLEGVVAKRLDSSYHPGQRSKAWVKVKHVKTQEAVVGGWTEGHGARSDSFGSLLLGLPLPSGGLEYIGRVGTGFDEPALRDMESRLRSIERKTSPFTAGTDLPKTAVHWTRPTLVAEVTFTERTGAGHLRHPVWRGLRPDKKPDQVIVEGA